MKQGRKNIMKITMLGTGNAVVTDDLETIEL